MRNNNRQVIRKLSVRSMRQNKMRNLFAGLAIILTCMLFTVTASMGIGMMQVAQEQTMREVGTRCHAGLKDVTGEEMEAAIVKEGKEAGQGVAYLDDGTMIVVEAGKRYLGETVTVLVTSVLQTSAGRMIFAKVK